MPVQWRTRHLFHLLLKTLKNCLTDELDIEINCLSEQELEEVLKDKNRSKKDKNSAVMRLLQCDKTDRQLKAIIGLMCGLTVKLADLFDDASLAETEKPSISFSGEAYAELRALIEPDLQERCVVVDMIKAIYDWSVLADILKGGEYEQRSYLSVAKVVSYENIKRIWKYSRRLSEQRTRKFIVTFSRKRGKTITVHISDRQPKTEKRKK